MTHQLINEQKKETLRIPHAPHPTSGGWTDAKCSTAKLKLTAQKKKILLVSVNL